RSRDGAGSGPGILRSIPHGADSCFVRSVPPASNSCGYLLPSEPGMRQGGMSKSSSRNTAVNYLSLSSLLLLAACASAPSAPQVRPPAGYPPSRIDLYFGGRSLSEEDWSPVEDQTTVGLEFVHEGHDDPVGFEAALFASEGSKNVDIGGSTVETSGRTGEFS